MKTILTKKQQADWLARNVATLDHHWSVRGMGSARVEYCGERIARASGCGYDRRGTVIADALLYLFADEFAALARKYARGRRRRRSGVRDVPAFYGLQYDAKNDRAMLDGACGLESVRRAFHAIGFSLEQVGEYERGPAGVEFWQIVPVKRRDLEWLRDYVKRATA